MAKYDDIAVVSPEDFAEQQPPWRVRNFKCSARARTRHIQRRHDTRSHLWVSATTASSPATSPHLIITPADTSCLSRVHIWLDSDRSLARPGSRLLAFIRASSCEGAKFRNRLSGRLVVGVDVDGTRTHRAARTRPSCCRLIGLTTATCSLQSSLTKQMEARAMEGTSIPQSPADAPTAPQTSTPDSDKLKRKRQPRNSACQGCAALKMKVLKPVDAPDENMSRLTRAHVVHIDPQWQVREVS